MDDERIAAAGALLARAWRDGTTIDALPGQLTPRSATDAAAVQDAMAARIGEPVVGWKIAGAPGRPCGRIFASTRFDSGATLPLPRYARTFIECEVGFRLRQALPPRERPYDREEVAAVADLALNLELVGSRIAGGKIIPDTEDERFVIVADNAAQSGLVTGPVIEDWRGRTLLDITVDLRVDGGGTLPLLPKEGRTDPLDVITWFANELSSRGTGLDAGQTVTPGSVTVPHLLPPGSTALAAFEDLGTIRVSVDAA